MSFINAIKLTLSRSGLMFKILLYDIIILVVIIGICAGVLITEINFVAEQIGELGLVDKFTAGVREYINNAADASLGDSLQQFYASTGEAIKIVSDNFFSTAYITLMIAFIVARFLFALRTLPTYDILNNYMKEGTNYFFMSSYIRNFAKSAKFAGLQTLFCLPFDILIFGAGYFLIGFLFGALGLFAPFVVIIVLICLLAFRNTLFFYWAPLVVQGEPMAKAFGESIKVAFRNFGDTFSMMVVCTMLIFSLIMGVTITTYGTGLLMLLPMAAIFTASLSLVKFYDYKRMRYYVHSDTVINPPAIEEFEIEDKQDILADDDDEEEQE
ncbi:MAG: hypothetical protein IKC83_02885 [Clostridia bacterium]|nr:hypothetical protein [Clostridia bacterium]